MIETFSFIAHWIEEKVSGDVYVRVSLNYVDVFYSCEGLQDLNRTILTLLGASCYTTAMEF